MNRSGLLIGVASVLAGTSVLLVVLGAVYNLLIALLAIPFGVAAYLLWMDATGRIQMRFREKQGRTSPTGGRTDRTQQTRQRSWDQRTPQPPREQPSRSKARRVLGVGPEADQAEIRSAYRDRVKEVHPDAENGDEEAFKRVSQAYNRLREQP